MSRSFRFASLLFACLTAAALFAQSAIAQPTAAFTPGRSHGVAPLAVFFDASGTTHSDANVEPFHDLTYEWSFSDFGSGSWSTSGKDRNRALGPETAHVFDTPGSYLVVLRVTDANGQSSIATHRIAVQDPEVVFEGTKTLCFANGSDFTGCPNGAELVTTATFDDVMERVADRRRLLLRRGDSFTVTDDSDLKKREGIIGAFGSGPKPIVQSALNGYMIRPRGLEDWRIMDLDVRGSDLSSQDRFMKAETEGSVQLLLYRMELSGFRGNAMLFHYLHLEDSGTRPHDQIFVADCKITNNVQNMVFIAGERVGILGNEIGDGEHHLVRLPFSKPAVIAHNNLYDAGQTYHLIKLHAADFTPSDGIGNSFVKGRYNEHVVISDNEFLGHEWSTTIAPQSSSSSDYDERIRHVIVERNHFRSKNSTSRHVVVRASYVTVRNNLMDFSYVDGSGQGGIELGHYSVIGEPSRGSRVYNNTCYSTLNSGSAQMNCVRIGEDVLDTVVRNNLMYSAHSNAQVVDNVAGSETVATSNVLTATNPFVSPTPVEAADFALDPGASSRNAGNDLDTVRLDYFEKPRPLSGTGSPSLVDLGAIEGDVEILAPILAPEVQPPAAN